MENIRIWEELVSTDVFNCAMCKNILVTPVWLTPNEKNLCNNCFQENREGENVTAIRNVALIQILEKLSFPCKCSKKGCGKVLKYQNYHKHVSECRYTKTCVVEQCEWRGIKEQLAIHLCDDHPEIVIDEENHSFSLTCTEEPIHTINVLQTRDGRFITHIWQSVEVLRLLIYSNDIRKSSIGQFTLQYRVNPSTVIQCECNVCDHFSCLNMLQRKCLTETYFNPNPDTQVIQLIYKPRDNRPVIPKSFLSYFVCHFCYDFIATERWECKLGHQVCDDCSLSNCRLCISDICVNVRDGQIDYDRCDTTNVSLMKIVDTYDIKCANCPASKCTLWEVTPGNYLCTPCRDSFEFDDDLVEVKTSRVPKDLVAQFVFPCRFADQGCKFVGPVPRHHENSCDYQKLCCPVSDCPVVDRYSKLLLHVSESHRDRCVVGNRRHFTNCIKAGIQVQFLICYHKLFIHTLQPVGHNYSLRVREMCRKNNKYFLFSVDIGCNSNKLNIRYRCGSAVLLRRSLFNLLFKENQVEYSVEIIRKSTQ